MSEPVVIALIGISGAVIGSIATIIGSIVLHCMKERAAAKREQPQRALLLAMLKHQEYQWRTLNTLMHVIGADEKTTKRLLLEVARPPRTSLTILTSKHLKYEGTRAKCNLYKSALVSSSLQWSQRARLPSNRPVEA